MNKSEYVKELCEFYKKTEPCWGLESLTYKTVGTDEWVIAEFQNGSRKKFNVNSDSFRGIFFDFAKFVQMFNYYDWE